MPWVNPPTRSTGYLWTASNQNDIINDLLYLVPVGYTEFTSDVGVTATTVATATQIVSLGALTYEAVPHVLEFVCRRAVLAVVANIVVRDGTTVIGSMTSLAAADSGSQNLEYQLTPTAASHTYNIAAWNGSAGTNTYKAGTGGAAGDGTTYLPGFIRAKRVPA